MNTELGPLPPCYFTHPFGRELWNDDQMRTYAAAAVAAERERWPDLIRQAMLDTAEDGDDEYAAQEADRITERLLRVLWPNTTDDRPSVRSI
jgi:hypothetical protein